MADLNSYLKKIEDEYREISDKAFWKEFLAAISGLRKKASRRCETEEDIKKWQGEIHGYDNVSNLPDKIIHIIREKNEKRATE